MPTIRHWERKIFTPSSFIPASVGTKLTIDQSKGLKIREFISWAVCFGIVTMLTGFLKILNIGVTMEPVTSIFFYSSLAGLAYFAAKAFRLSRTVTPQQPADLVRLN